MLWNFVKINTILQKTYTFLRKCYTPAGRFRVICFWLIEPDCKIFTFWSEAHYLTYFSLVEKNDRNCCISIFVYWSPCTLFYHFFLFQLNKIEPVCYSFPPTLSHLPPLKYFFGELKGNIGFDWHSNTKLLIDFTVFWAEKWSRAIRCRDKELWLSLPPRNDTVRVSEMIFYGSFSRKKCPLKFAKLIENTVQ